MGYFTDASNLRLLNQVSISIESIRIRRTPEAAPIMVYKSESSVISLSSVSVNPATAVKKETIKFKKKKIDYIYKLFFPWFIKAVYEYDWKKDKNEFNLKNKELITHISVCFPLYPKVLKLAIVYLVSMAWICCDFSSNFIDPTINANSCSYIPVMIFYCRYV